MQIVPYDLPDLSEPPKTKVLASTRNEHYSRNFRKINPCFFDFNRGGFFVARLEARNKNHWFVGQAAYPARPPHKILTWRYAA